MDAHQTTQGCIVQQMDAYMGFAGLKTVKKAHCHGVLFCKNWSLSLGQLRTSFKAQQCSPVPSGNLMSLTPHMATKSNSASFYSPKAKQHEITNESSSSINRNSGLPKPPQGLLWSHPSASQGPFSRASRSPRGTWL